MRITKLAAICLAVSILITGCGLGNHADIPYDNPSTSYFFSMKDRYEDTFASNLCIVTDKENKEESSDFSAASTLIFDVTNQKVIFAKQVHEKLYPASITKIMTAFVVLKYADLSDTVTFSYNASHITEWGAKLCGFQEGDQMNLKDLLYAFLIYSGNDAGIALAEHIAGSVEAFADLMNQEAKALGATNSHFVNPHGLHDDEHYTTTYDIYLIFNALIKNDLFLDMIHSKSINVNYTTAKQETKSADFYSTNRYLVGKAKAPEGITVIGGKTGTTQKAGSCLVLYSQDSAENDYISVVFRATDGNALFDQMTGLLKLIP